MSAADVMDVLDDLSRPTLADLQALSVELGSAIGPGKEWGRIDGPTFVSASRDQGRVAIVGCTGGWHALRCPEDGPATTSDLFGTATEAVTSLGGPR